MWHLEPEQMNTGEALLDYQDELQITAKSYEVIVKHSRKLHGKCFTDKLYTTITIHGRYMQVIHQTH